MADDDATKATQNDDADSQSNDNPDETWVVGHDGKRVTSKEYRESDEHTHGYNPEKD